MAEGEPSDLQSVNSEGSVIVIVDTRNKFDALSETHETMDDTTTQGGGNVRDDRERKRKRVNTGNVGNDYFRMMSNEDKLDVIFSKLINIEQKQSIIEKLETVTQCNSSELCSLKKTATVHDDMLTFLSYKSLDLEARSRRKNLIFRG